MKRALAFTLMVLAIMIIAVSCEEPQAHVHTYSEKWECDDTYHWHEATCHTDEVDGKEAHKFGNLIPDVAATESTTGKGHRVCSVCGYERKEEISALGHSHKLSSVYSKDATGHWQTCSGCNSKVNYSAHTISCVSADDLEHDYKCTVCGYVEKTETHSLVEIEDLTTGEKEQSCKKCSYKKSLAAVKTEKADVTTKTVTNAGGTETVVNQNPVSIDVAVSANETTNTSTSNPPEEKTVVSFPAESLKMAENATSVSLTVKAVTVTEVSSAADYAVTTEEESTDSTPAVVAGFEFTLTGADSSDFGNTGVTVKTYISPGLTTSDITSYNENNKLKIKYVGEERTNTTEPQITKYITKTGYLEYTVYHFSKYAIYSEDVVAVDTDGNMYTSLESAVSDVKTGRTVTLLKNMDLTPKANEQGRVSAAATIEVKKSLTLNLNGKTLKSNNRVFQVKNGALTIQNGTVEDNNASYMVDGAERKYDMSVIRVGDSETKSSNLGLVIKEDAIINGLNCYGISAFGLSDATLDIYGTINSANACIAGYGGTDDWNTGKITINVKEGAKLTAYGAALENDNGTITASAETSIYDDACGIYQPNVGGQLNISGGTITSKTYSAIEIRNGNANISGGSLIGAETYSLVDPPSTGGPCVKGAAVAVNYYGSSPDKNGNGVTVTITGGTLSGGKELAVVDTLGSGVSVDVKRLAKAIVYNVTLKNIEGKTADTTSQKTYYVSMEAYNAANPNRTSVWDGTVYTWESDYNTNNKEGFIKNSNLDTSVADTTCVKNAKNFLEYFDKNLVNTGDIAVNGPSVTISSATGLASFNMIKQYFAAKYISNKNINTEYASYYTNAWGAVKIVVNVDIDLGISKTKGWTPLDGDYQVDFRDHTVSNLYCDRKGKDYAALFKNCGVKNLTLSHAFVIGSQYVGAVTAERGNLAGHNEVNLEFCNVTVEHSTILGYKYVGGIVGHSYKNITGCKVYDTNVKGITGGKAPYQVGGVVGYQLLGTVSNCTVSNCTVTASENVGGIAGRAYNQDEGSFTIKENIVTKTKVVAVEINDEVETEKEKAESLIGTSSYYVGYICGGEYLGLTNKDNKDAYKGTPNQRCNDVCEIYDNTVDGKKYNLPQT